jgi:hypothetical protein
MGAGQQHTAFHWQSKEKRGLSPAGALRFDGGDWLVNGGTRLGRETSERKCSRLRDQCTGVSYFLGNSPRVTMFLSDGKN